MSGFGNLSQEEATRLYPEFGNGKIEEALVFRSAREIAAQTPEEPEWICEGLVACGAITELDGEAKRAGKTTFIGHLVHACLEGEDFLGRQTMTGPVVWLTEERDQSFRQTLGRCRLDEAEQLWVLEYHQTIEMKWPDVVQAAVLFAQSKGARFLIVDTLPAFAGLNGERENQAGEALASMKPLIQAAALGMGVLVTRHERKSGGEVGTSARGSGAFTGAMDVVLKLARGEEKDTLSENQRILTGVGRFDAVPEQMVIEINSDLYREVGQKSKVRNSQARQLLLDHLPKEQVNAVPLSSLWQQGGPLFGHKISPSTFYRHAGQLADEDLLGRHGATKHDTLWWVRDQARPYSHRQMRIDEN